MGRKTRRKCKRRARLDVTASDDTADIQPRTDDIIHSVDDSFNHRFDYHIDSSWQLPSSAKFFREGSSAWQDNELTSMKLRLNDVKSRLSNVDIVTWQNHTQVCCCA